jgi:hypothetical protein
MRLTTCTTREWCYGWSTRQRLWRRSSCDTSPRWMWSGTDGWCEAGIRGAAVLRMRDEVRSGSWALAFFTVRQRSPGRPVSDLPIGPRSFTILSIRSHPGGSGRQITFSGNLRTGIRGVVLESSVVSLRVWISQGGPPSPPSGFPCLPFDGPERTAGLPASSIPPSGGETAESCGTARGLPPFRPVGIAPARSGGLGQRGRCRMRRKALCFAAFCW